MSLGRVYKRGTIWWTDYRFDGLRVRKAIGSDKKLAQEALAADLGDIVHGAYKLKRRDNRMYVREMLDIYRAKKREAMKRSLARDESSFKNLLPEFGHKLLDQVTPRDVEVYKARRRLEVSGSTVNRELALLKNFFNIAIAEGLIEHNPVKGVKFFPESGWRHKYVLSGSEIQRLLEAAAPHLRPILIVAFGTGLRKGDILGLTWEEVDFEKHVIARVMQKTGDAIEIPMLPIVESALRALRAAAGGNAAGLIFTSTVHPGAQFVDIKTAFHAALRRSGLADKGYRFHDIRRTFASALANKGVPLPIVKQLLGHRSVVTTERYLNVKLEDKRLAVLTLGPAWDTSWAQPLKPVIETRLLSD